MTRDKDPDPVPAAPTKGDVLDADASVADALPSGSQEADAEDAPRDHLHITEVYRQNLARNIKRLRKGKKLTQEGLGQLIGVGQAHITMLERAKVDASLKSITRVARALGTDPVQLLSPPPPSDLVRLPWTESSRPEQEAETGPAPYAAHASFSTSTEGRAAGGERGQPAPMDGTQDAGPPPSFDAVLGSLGQGLSLTVAKHMAGAVHKRLEAMERKHGSVPLTRPMLNALLVAMLNASQNIDYANEEETSDRA